MSIIPGTYIIHKVNTEDLVLDHVHSPHRFQCHKVHRKSNQQWYVGFSENKDGYYIQSVWGESYLKANGDRLCQSCVHDATVWEINQVYGDVYSVSVKGTKIRLWLPTNKVATMVNLIEKDPTEDPAYLWKFEKIGDKFGEKPNPTPPTPTLVQESLEKSRLKARPNSVSSMNHPGPCNDDDAHFLTDMLFNMPRNTFSRAQRRAALDWARRMGAQNVPTIESFEEYERVQEVSQGGGGKP